MPPQVIDGPRGPRLSMDEYGQRDAEQFVPEGFKPRNKMQTPSDPADYIEFQSKYRAHLIEIEAYPDIQEGSRRRPDPRNSRVAFKEGRVRLHRVRDAHAIQRLLDHPMCGVGLEFWSMDELSAAHAEAQVVQLQQQWTDPRFLDALKKNISAADFAALESLARPKNMTQAEYERSMQSSDLAPTPLEEDPELDESDEEALSALDPEPVAKPAKTSKSHKKK